MRAPWTLLILLAAALTSAAAVTHVLPAGGAAASESSRGEAEQAFRTGRHAAAYARFVTLADAGDADAAELALVMLRHGPALFGSDWSASADQQRHWRALVAQSEGRRIAAIDNAYGD